MSEMQDSNPKVKSLSSHYQQATDVRCRDFEYVNAFGCFLFINCEEKLLIGKTSKLCCYLKLKLYIFELKKDWDTYNTVYFDI